MQFPLYVSGLYNVITKDALHCAHDPWTSVLSLPTTVPFKLKHCNASLLLFYDRISDTAVIQISVDSAKKMSNYVNNYYNHAHCSPWHVTGKKATN